MLYKPVKTINLLFLYASNATFMFEKYIGSLSFLPEKKSSNTGDINENIFFEMTKVRSCYYICLLFFSSAIFIPSGRVATLSELLWIVGVNDFILKFVSVIIKIFVILLPSTILQHRKRVSFKLCFFKCLMMDWV